MVARKTDYPTLRQHLSPDLAEASDQRIEAVLKTRNIDAESMEGFLSDLGKVASSVGQTVLKAAPSVLPVAGTVLGTAFGGPLGGALGGKLGSLAGGALGAATGQPAGGAQGSPLSGLLGAGLGALTGSPAAGQLLQTVLKPQTLQALTSMALGPAGRSSIPVGGTPVPVGAFTNLLGVLAGRAEAEYNASMSAMRGDTPKYMQDYAGEAKGDPAVPQHRAEALYELLEFAEYESESEQESSESVEAATFARWEREMEAFQAEYDAMELEAAYESEYESEEY